MNEKFIAMTNTFPGYWGKGNNVAEALANLKKNGGRKNMGCTVYRFTASLPFAPPEREANPSEADCWIGRGTGSIITIRCEMEEVTV